MTAEMLTRCGIGKVFVRCHARTHTHTHTHKQTNKQTDTQTNKHTHTLIHKQANKQALTHILLVVIESELFVLMQLLLFDYDKVELANMNR